MRVFLCGHCGAGLELPDDEDQLEAKCMYCKKTTLVPADIAAMRRSQPVAAERDRRVPIVAAAAGVAALMALIGIVLAMRPAPERPPVLVAPPPAVPVAPPPREPELPPKVDPPPDPTKSGEVRAAALMNEMRGSGCKSVILSPVQASGEQNIETKLVKNGMCVAIFAVTGAAENNLSVTLRTPLGDPLPVPNPAPEVRMTVCPKMRGIHPMRIVPTTKDPFTVGAMECPAPRPGKRT